MNAILSSPRFEECTAQAIHDLKRMLGTRASDVQIVREHQAELAVDIGHLAE